MATTKAKETQTPTRSKSLPSPTQRSTKQFTTHAASADHKDKSSTSTQKPIPNYLKHTLSSRPEPLKFVKKNGLEAHKKLIRRRSLDRPPSASPRLQKSLISPDPKERASLREKPTTLRSLSYPAKPINNAPKPISDKAAKTPNSKAGKLPSRGNLKKDTSASTSKKVPATRSITDQSLNIETRHEEKESFVYEEDDEEIVKVATEVEVVVPKEPKSERGQVLDYVDTEVEIDDQEEKNNRSCDVSTILEDYNVSQTFEAKDKLDEQKINNEGQAEDNHISKLDEATENQFRELDETIDNYYKENSREKTKIEAEDKGDETNEKEATSEEIVDENKIEAKIDDEGSQLELESSKELGEDVEGGVNEEAKPETATKVAAKRQERQGKKESPGAYNDVIEETASKLLEKRKNKVRALVGAFETVIDYESGSK